MAQKKIPKNAFRKCGDWVKIDIPEGVTSIDEYAFYMCENLKEVTFPSTLKYIDAGAFGHCTSIKKIVLPVDLKGIGYHAFYRNRFDSITCRPENPKSVNRFSYTHTDEYNSDIANSRYCFSYRLFYGAVSRELIYNQIAIDKNAIPTQS